jgi:hypothetical protein
LFYTRQLLAAVEAVVTSVFAVADVAVAVSSVVLRRFYFNADFLTDVNQGGFALSFTSKSRTKNEVGT